MEALTPRGLRHKSNILSTDTFLQLFLVGSNTVGNSRTLPIAKVLNKDAILGQSQ